MVNCSQTAIGSRPLAVNFETASALTSISNSLRKMARTGQLKTTRVGRRRIVPLNALNELVQNGLNESCGETR